MTNSNFVYSGKNNPCPICDRTKDNDCHICKGGNMVLCHSSIDGEATKDRWKYIKPDRDRNWGIYVRSQEKSPRPNNTTITHPFIDIHGKNHCLKRRYDSNGKKKINWTKPLGVHESDLLPYQWSEVKEAIASGLPIYLPEGELCVDALQKKGLNATSLRTQPTPETIELFKGANLIICPDRDRKGTQKAEELYNALKPVAASIRLMLAEPIQWNYIPNEGGRDIYDWIVDGCSKDDIEEAIVPFDLDRFADLSGQHTDNPEETFLQKACKALYSPNQWICFNNILYKWAGTHYTKVIDESEYPRIRAFCNTYKTQDKNGNYIYPYSKPKFVKEILEWQKMGCMVGAEDINPAGLNCTNGVLEWHWVDRKLVVKLLPHTCDRYYLSEPKVTFDPKADATEYERLMQCLDPASRNIWERTLAAALDIKTVRKYTGRSVRALFLKGDGHNGKDTLRAIAEMIFGKSSISSCSATDFKNYDSGRYFPIYALRGKVVNWPSENADVGRIDQLRGLRAAITGDPITFEAKNCQGIQEPCRAVFLFNINEAPNLVNTLEASRSRWGIIPFERTYSNHPKSGELQADPRFKEDPQFICDRILPAFLNCLLAQLQVVVNEGIDYSPTEALLDEIQREASHLLQFAYDTGLHYDPNLLITVKELWEKLKQWYIETGTATIEPGKEKLIWTDQARQNDRNVKSPNQVIPRFLEIFPKAKKATIRDPIHRNLAPRILGIGYADHADYAE